VVRGRKGTTPAVAASTRAREIQQAVAEGLRRAARRRGGRARSRIPEGEGRPKASADLGRDRRRGRGSDRRGLLPLPVLLRAPAVGRRWGRGAAAAQGTG